ncbi:dr1-associated corepressor isoform X2 [Dunckerocampus dactyliophorus]|uniref:dr1-associated corepressor isoform X2 n=1 Tax=Dunckerocampus dactyliophorus TaxID=161453 RepID=UPI0024075E18|nr:dr1-associated corepressor isoform X2 [Dunckerocampus dactyliophorus]
MPSKKKKYNARFPPARIKKIMQTDEEIGKVAAAVPVIISRALELFLESLLTKACHVTQSKNAKTMTTSHLKQCIELEQQFDFLKDLVAAVPDMQGEGEDNHAEAGGEKIPRRGRKSGSGHKNGGPGSKGKDKKLSGTESEQEDDSEDSETDGDEEDGSQSSTNLQAASRFHSANAQHMHTGSMAAGQPRSPVAFAPPHASMVSAALPPPASAPPKSEDYDDEDYDS